MHRASCGFRLFLAYTFLTLLSILAAAPASAACDRSGCGFASCATPATPVPEARWGELQPADASFSLCTPSASGPVACRDSTAFNEVTTQYRVFPWFMGVASENGYVFAGLAHGLEILDARAHPGNPTFLSRIGFTSFPVWTNNPEIKWPLQDVATVAGADNVAVLGGEGGIGLSVVDTSDKAAPRVTYQSTMKDGEEVYAATLGGRQTAFLAASTGSPTGGLFAYDLAHALSAGGCSESAPASPASCPGVYLGKVGMRNSVLFVGGTGRWLVDSSGTARGFEIWDVQNPAVPALKLSGLGDHSVYGVAMWQAAGKVYLATRAEYFDAGLGRSINQALVYDVSCVATTCGALPAPLAALELGSGGTPNYFVTFSQSGATPFLYFGSDDRCSGGGQREWLFDVSNPAAPHDITPAGYWDWYYRGNPTGFNDLMPRRGKFVGDFFYRAALSLLDIHQWNPSGTASPFIFVSGPNAGEIGQTFDFSATAGRCTPNPSGWSWSAPGGTISGSFAGSSIAVSWPTPGLYTVTASNNACGSAQNGRSVTVTASGPVAASFTISSENPPPGTPVTFDASGSTGGPTSYSWTFGDGGSASGKVVTHTYFAVGDYVVRLTVSKPGCGEGICSSTSTKGEVVGSGPPPPPDASFTTSAPCVNEFGFDTCQAPTATAVQLTASFSAAGATYLWEFGDGATATGKTATHSWSKAGDYAVRLTVTVGQQSAFSSKTFDIGGTSGGTPCIADDSRLCLAGGRFAVSVAWKTPQGMGAGHAVPLTADTGTFWFFSSANLELVVKVINACGPFGRYWVFAGGLTNVQVTLTVTDSQTGAHRTYTSAQGVPYQPLQDTAAFSSCP